jgi:hypothetical protein
MKQTPKITIKALFTPAIREGVRRWLAGASRKTLPGRKDLGKGECPKTYRKTIMAVLGVKSWPEAMRLRKQARSAAKKAAKGAQKREAKSDAASQRRAA